MRRGVLLHDIGKMGVPESILLKPGTLTEEEWQFVVKHPAMAIQIFQDIPYLKDALDLVFSHHEHLDGGGYPDKLAADEIPAAARAFSIVDNWDVLRSDRPYSKAWTDDEAHSYLQEQAGKKFDPKMVTAFFEMLEAEPQRKSPK